MISAASVRISRRRTLGLALLGAVSLLAGGHAPYGQWGVYRKRNLLILTARDDPTSYELGTQIAAVLAESLPESRARVSRGPHKQRIASLMSSKQMDVAVMHRDDAANLRAGASPFADYGPVPLHTIVAVGDYRLVCRDDFPGRHAWLIAEALSKHQHSFGDSIRVSGEAPEARVPLHPGAQAYFSGRPLPAPEPETEVGRDHRHAD
jgi:TRAP-type uncharacterized transport system substrate-binding protein